MRGKDFLYIVIGLIVLYAFGKVVYEEVTGTDAESVAKREAIAARKEIEDADARRAFEKEEARRAFALKESPVLWKTIEDLKARIREQNGKLNKLKRTFDDLGMSANEDNDYISLVRERDEMVGRLAEVNRELDRAYLAAVKYEVTRGKAEKVDFERKAREDDVSEAAQSRAKYDELRKSK
ncbi:MAG: hypothetical protein Q4G65_03625 [bacterium]|nr:hypothetical protein [bacterium]